MRAYNHKRKPKHMTKLTVKNRGIHVTYMKKLSFVNNEYIEYCGVYHELVRYWKNKTGWIMETTTWYFPIQYREYKEKIYGEPFPKYSGVRIVSFYGYTTKHVSWERY